MHFAGKIFLSYRYHQIHKMRARKILKTIESVRGNTETRLIRLSNEYASDVFGWRGYAPWLYVYSAMNGCFKEGWIPDNYYGCVVVPLLKGDYGAMSNLKALTHKIFNGRLDPSSAKALFPDRACYVNGLFFSTADEPVSDAHIGEFLFKHSDNVVFKADNSLQGRDIFFFNKASFDISKIQSMGNGVFQSFIKQHYFFNRMMPSSVATLRVTTVIDNFGEVSVRACYLRIGRNVDTHIKSLSHIRIPVNLESGKLGAIGYLPNWLPIDRHPDTGDVFADLELPLFHDCKAAAVNLHKLVPFVRCVGWDMIVDENNCIRVMEWNGAHNDIKFSEATQGPCFLNLGWEELWKKNRSRIFPPRWVFRSS